MTPELTIEEVAFHRNGVSGEGFYAVRFLSVPEDVERPEHFLAILFDAPGQCAVVNLDRLAQSGVAFGANSWRGDRFEPELRRAIETSPWSCETSGGVRVGPFCFPTDRHEGN